MSKLILCLIALVLEVGHATDADRFSLLFFNTEKRIYALVIVSDQGATVPTGVMRDPSRRQGWPGYEWEVYMGPRTALRQIRAEMAAFYPDLNRVTLGLSTGARASVIGPGTDHPRFYILEPDLLALLHLETEREDERFSFHERVRRIEDHAERSSRWVTEGWARVRLTEEELRTNFKIVDFTGPGEISLQHAMRCEDGFRVHLDQP